MFELNSLNVFVNNFLGFVQSTSYLPWVRWLLKLMALAQAIIPAGWPQSYPLSGKFSFFFCNHIRSIFYLNKSLEVDVCVLSPYSSSSSSHHIRQI